MSSQFKIGDWVRSIKNKEIVDKVTYTGGFEEEHYFSMPSFSWCCRPEDFELWSPLTNEWVWHKLLGTICQYKGPIEDSDLFSFYVPNFNHPQYSVTCA